MNHIWGFIFGVFYMGFIVYVVSPITNKIEPSPQYQEAAYHAAWDACNRYDRGDPERDACSNKKLAEWGLDHMGNVQK